MLTNRPAYIVGEPFPESFPERIAAIEERLSVVWNDPEKRRVLLSTYTLDTECRATEAARKAERRRVAGAVESRLTGILGGLEAIQAGLRP